MGGLSWLLPGLIGLMERRNLEIAALVFAIIVAVAMYFVATSGTLRNFRHLGYLGVFLIMLVSSATILVPIPGFVAAVFAGHMLNPFLVGIVAGVGSSIGELTGYSAGYGSRLVIKDKESGNYKKVENWMRNNGFLTVLVLAFIPNPFFDIAGIAAGGLGYSYWRFFIACCIGKTLRFILLALLGASLL